jgi:GTP cyclohydrolase FolE2
MCTDQTPCSKSIAQRERERKRVEKREEDTHTTYIIHNTYTYTHAHTHTQRALPTSGIVSDGGYVLQQDWFGWVRGEEG